MEPHCQEPDTVEQFFNKQEYIFQVLADLPDSWANLIETFNINVRHIKQLYQVGINAYATSHNVLTEISCCEGIAIISRMRSVHGQLHKVLDRLCKLEPHLDDEYHPEYYTNAHIAAYMAILHEYGVSNRPEIRRYKSFLHKVDERINSLLDASEVYIYGLCGLVKEALNEHVTAIELYTKALNHNPSNDLLRYRIGMIYIKLNNPLLSFINVNQMVGNFKYSFKAMALKAVALEQIGDYQNAYDAYDVCVRLAPDIQCQNAVIKTRDALVSKYGLDVGKYT